MEYETSHITLNGPHWNHSHQCPIGSALKKWLWHLHVPPSPLSHPAQHWGDGGSCFPLAAQLPGQQSSCSILFVLTAALLIVTAPPSLGILRWLNPQSTYPDPSNVKKSPPQRTDWRRKIISFSNQVIQVWLSSQLHLNKDCSIT